MSVYIIIYICGKSPLLVGKSTANGPFSIMWFKQCRNSTYMDTNSTYMDNHY